MVTRGHPGSGAAVPRYFRGGDVYRSEHMTVTTPGEITFTLKIVSTRESEETNFPGRFMTLPR